MTIPPSNPEAETCPAQALLKSLSGKNKAEIFRLAATAPLRFSSLLRQIPGSNKQSLTVALREMEAEALLQRVVVQEKPLHVEYMLTPKGQLLIPVFQQLEKLRLD